MDTAKHPLMHRLHLSLPTNQLSEYINSIRSDTLNYRFNSVNQCIPALFLGFFHIFVTCNQMSLLIQTLSLELLGKIDSCLALVEVPWAIHVLCCPPVYT